MNPDLALLVAVAAGLVVLCAVVAVPFGGWLILRHMDHLRRIERREAGLPEAPREPRKKREPIPEGIRKMIQPFESSQVRRGLEEECQELYDGGVPWSEIQRTLEQQLSD